MSRLPFGLKGSCWTRSQVEPNLIGLVHATLIFQTMRAYIYDMIRSAQTNRRWLSGHNDTKNPFALYFGDIIYVHPIEDVPIIDSALSALCLPLYTPAQVAITYIYRDTTRVALGRCHIKDRCTPLISCRVALPFKIVAGLTRNTEGILRYKRICNRVSTYIMNVDNSAHNLVRI